MRDFAGDLGPNDIGAWMNRRHAALRGYGALRLAGAAPRPSRQERVARIDKERAAARQQARELDRATLRRVIDRAKRELPPVPLDWNGFMQDVLGGMALEEAAKRLLGPSLVRGGPSVAGPAADLSIMLHKLLIIWAQENDLAARNRLTGRLYGPKDHYNPYEDD